MNSRKPDPFEGAPCRAPQEWEWARQHRASRWDFRIDSEDDHRRALRHEAVKRECLKCPSSARAACQERHDRLVFETGGRVPGIWAGTVYADRIESERTPGDDDDDGALISRSELAA